MKRLVIAAVALWLAGSPCQAAELTITLTISDALSQGIESDACKMLEHSAASGQTCQEFTKTNLKRYLLEQTGVMRALREAANAE